MGIYYLKSFCWDDEEFLGMNGDGFNNTVTVLTAMELYT